VTTTEAEAEAEGEPEPEETMQAIPTAVEVMETEEPTSQTQTPNDLDVNS